MTFLRIFPSKVQYVQAIQAKPISSSVLQAIMAKEEKKNTKISDASNKFIQEII